MDKLISFFSSNPSSNRKRRRESVPAYDLPLLQENRKIVIPPKPPHMSGKSIAPNFVGKSKKPQQHMPIKNDENCDMSNILFGEPIPGIEDTKQPLAHPNSSRSNTSRYPTMALFK